MFAMLLFTHHYPARCFGMNMPIPRHTSQNSIAAAIWNEFWLRYCERSEQYVCDCERYYVTRFDLEIIV